MPMNIVIQEQRKLLGLTQEQVADYLGVSTPAVSKWEKGITSPDIGLLPPLARLLKIDLNTLFCFSEDLSEQEIGFFCNELAKQARNDILSAFDAGIVHKAPTEPQSLAERTTPKGIPPPILWVVSKCALRDSSEAAKAYAFNRLFSSIFTSSSSIV